MRTKDLTQAVIDDLWLDHQGTNKALRFGQYVCQRLFIENDPKLFLESDDLQAYDSLVNRVKSSR